MWNRDREGSEILKWWNLGWLNTCMPIPKPEGESQGLHRLVNEFSVLFPTL